MADSAAPRLSTAPRDAPTAILLGAEADGLPQNWIDSADMAVTIPMAAGVDSLNVAVASGVFLYHFTQCRAE